LKFADWMGILTICISSATIFVILRGEAKQRKINKRIEILQKKNNVKM
tara:strand:+ start:1275 stop:1418 length:144 start_codon:yes stop_codon:yes gene_type:complete